MHKMKIPQILTLIHYQSEKKRDADAHENKNEHAGW